MAILRMDLLRKLWRYFISWKEKGYIDIELYNVIIDGMCKNDKFDKAHIIFEKVSLIGLRPNIHYNS